MHLSVTCPRCESKYQLDAGMRGKRMRCPNPICRAVFEVRDDNDAPAQAPAVEAKRVEEPKGKESPPPVVTKPVEATPVEALKPEPVQRRPVPKPIEQPPVPDFADDFPDDDEAAPAPQAPAIATEAWQPEAVDAPPVREEVAAEPMPVRQSIAPPSPTPAPVKRRRALWVIAAMVLVLGIVAGAGYWRIRGSIASNETERFQKAEELYKQQEFALASSALQKLYRDFPDSPHNGKYRFLAELSDVREAVRTRESPDETTKALERVGEFARTYNGDPFLKERETDLWQTLDFLAAELTRLAEQDKDPALVVRAKRAWAAAKKYPPPAGTSPAERERTLQKDWTRIELMLAAHFERQQIIAALQKHLEHATAASVQEAWALVDKTKRQDDAEIRKLLDELVEAHRDQVKFVPADPQAKLPILDEDALPSLSVTPSVKAERAVAAAQPLVLGLARGVLYALEPAKGELRWARRVGIDTNVLPLRVPADAITPELLLVVSSDQRSLSALVAETGAVLWQTPLSDVCLGQPVLVDRQVLAPTLAGRIEEIEIAEGRLIGSYHVGQPLSLGGMRQPGTPFVYFPADEFCLYVLDITKRTCTKILYTRHPAGSLRGLPAIVSADKGAFLLWSQAQGLDRVEIKPYALPIGHHEQKPVEPILKMAAMSAPPWCGADRLAVATETGFLSLWGFRQKDTRDPLLFRLMKQDVLIDESKGAGRCQVVHANLETYWTLTRGKLRCVETTFQPAQGPGMLTRWTQPSPLGTLLHAADVRREPDGRTILFLTTQAGEHPACLASAVDADDGKILWQRQLGVLPQQAPIVAGGQILVRDALGVMRFDARKFGDNPEKRWQQAGDWLAQEAWTDATHILLTRESSPHPALGAFTVSLLACPLGQGPLQAAFALVAQRSEFSYVQLTLPRRGKDLHVRIGPIAGDDKSLALDVKLPATLQGTPALGNGFLLLPLADGIIRRVSLQDGSSILDRDWRAVGAEADARGHLVLVNATDFVLTDGSSGLTHVVSTDGKTWVKRAETKLAHRITKAPVILPATQKDKQRLCVADASDTLTLLEVDRLKVLRRWSLQGKITAGPFVRGDKIGCIVGRNRLIWLDPKLDPKQDSFAWEYTFDADIVGEPHVIEGELVVADVAGQFRSLDPTSGGRLGAGLTLKANVAATAAPLPFGAGQAFAPLTDGTIVIVPLKKLRNSP